MKTLLKTVALAGALLASASAQAQCFGSGTFKTCTDASGNNYSIQRFGNQTIMQGNNPRTGSTWSQQSFTTGNTTQTYGNTNGRTWNQTTITRPNGFQTFGTDSRGNSFNKNCFGAFCN